MNFADIQGEMRRLDGAVRTLAAIGAALRLRQLGEAASPEVAERLDAVVRIVLPGGFESLDARQVSVLLASLALSFSEARDLFQYPGRPAGWTSDDPELLTAQGEVSRFVMRTLAELAAGRPAITAALGGRMLDVGTGVSALALEAVERFPALHVVGLDIHEPALRLAHAKVAASPHAARIEIRNEDVTAFDEEGAYTLVWLPVGFMRKEVARAALDRLAAALRSDGFLVVGFMPPPADPLGSALAALRLVRSGGDPWTAPALEAELLARGFREVESLNAPPITLVLGRRA